MHNRRKLRLAQLSITVCGERLAERCCSVRVRIVQTRARLTQLRRCARGRVAPLARGVIRRPAPGGGALRRSLVFDPFHSLSHCNPARCCCLRKMKSKLPPWWQRAWRHGKAVWLFVIFFKLLTPPSCSAILIIIIFNHRCMIINIPQSQSQLTNSSVQKTGDHQNKQP